LKQSAIVVLAIVAISTTAQADDHDRKSKPRRESHNYIIERQQAYQVQGVPAAIP
jgi:hypothetical protein